MRIRKQGILLWSCLVQLMKGDEPMKRNLYLLCAAMCLLSCAACGRNREMRARVPETTVSATARRTTRRTETRTAVRGTTRVGKDMRDMANDAAEGMSEIASDAAAKGKALVTDAAADLSEAAAVRKGDGDYNAEDDGKVTEKVRR